MSMTKAEAKRVADLELALAMARSLRWPEYNMPAPMTEQEIRNSLVDGGVQYRGSAPQKVARGWFANSHSARVTYGCSSGTTCNTEGDSTCSQGMGRMFASEIDAWKAVRYETTERFAAELAKIDAEIAGTAS